MIKSKKCISILVFLLASTAIFAEPLSNLYTPLKHNSSQTNPAIQAVQKCNVRDYCCQCLAWNNNECFPNCDDVCSDTGRCPVN